jgi:hypothetical protein
LIGDRGEFTSGDFAQLADGAVAIGEIAVPFYGLSCSNIGLVISLLSEGYEWNCP